MISGALYNDLPHARCSWWYNLLLTHPEHVIVETFLILLILYIAIVKRAYDPQKRCDASDILTYVILELTC